MISFFVQGTPKAQPRPRATRRGAFVGVYNPDTADAWKEAVAIEAKPYRPSKPLDGAVGLWLHFYFARPKSHRKTCGDLRAGAPAHHVSKPDCDNTAKAVQDVLTKSGFWKDDAQVVALHVAKLYADSPDAKEGCWISVESFT